MTTPLQSVRAGSGVSPNWVNGRPITMSNADLNPADVGAMMKRANAAFSARHMSEAACHYREVLAVSPNDAHALHHLALACVHTNAIDDANAHIGLALKAAPERAELWEHAGLIAALKREYVHAEACYQRAIDITGSTATLHRNLADCLRQLGRLPEAKPHYKIAIDLEPELHHAIRALARISKELGEIDDAADYWLRTWLIDPTCLADGLDLIAALKNAGRRGEIDAIAEKMESIFASDPSALGELAHALICADCFHKAGRVGKRGLEVDPHNANLHHQVTYAFTLLGAFAEMRAHSIEAARLSPGNVFMQYNLATTHLRLGEFSEGWKQYKWQQRLPHSPPLDRPSSSEWHGERVKGCRFLLVGEQGCGDQIQFLRMADWLHREGAIVDVWVRVEIAELAWGANGVNAVWTEKPSVSYDYWCRMFRMPAYMRCDFTTLPIATRYLSAPDERVHQWRAYIGGIAPTHGRKRKRVGLVWAGDPNHGLDRYRSISLGALRPALEHARVTWFSIQKGEREREGEALAHELDFHTLGPVIANFSDTLAIVQTLDLVISVDTSVAHLAGAAGRPVWVLLPTCADWRWLANRTANPWYPSMRLFRQRVLGEWDTVVEEVRQALLEWCDAP
jgi:tetratricopeptide (TPR) repeat protein